MGQLDQFAEEVGDIMASLEKDAEAMNRRKRALIDRSADVFGRWRRHFDQQESSLQAAEAAINKLSNVPLTGTSTFKADPPKADPRLVASLSETPLRSAKPTGEDGVKTNGG